ncbi:MAG: hypothetical protein FJ147_25755 [Deltaproteobacteria bacterium]|nr:hypothetical protein [Deltaproteobacteria bacterium]
MDEEETYLVRVLQDGQWTDTWQVPAEYEPPQLAPIIDEFLLERIKRANYPQQGSWMTDCLLLPTVVGEGDRPFYPHSFLVMNEAALVLGMELLKPGEREREVPARFLKIVQQLEMLPQLLIVGSDSAFVLLEPIAEALGIEITQESEIPVFQEFLEELVGAIGRG